MKNIAVFVSGYGTNLQAMINRIAKGTLRVNLKLVLSDKSSAFALRRAKKAGIPAFFVDPKKFTHKNDYEHHLISLLEDEKIDFIVLAGFMRILGPVFLKKYKNRILNIHPALLPAFKGAHAIHDAYEYGAKVTGVTVHFVDEKIDNGPIIMQEVVSVGDHETMSQLEKRIHKVEHGIYSEAIQKVCDNRFSIRGRRVVLRAKIR
jgi:phosphoribosylglycinamide formyltransferase-1